MTTRRQHSPSRGGVLPKMAYAPGEAPPERVGIRYYACTLKGRILLVLVLLSLQSVKKIKRAERCILWL